MLRRTTVALGVVMALVLGTGVVLASHYFSDVPDSNKFHDDIAWLVDNEIVSAGGTFAPKDALTRQAFARWLRNYDTNIGPAASCEYGVASVEVKKGDGAFIPQASYSVELGSPIADTTGGVFRFTCDAAEAPCEIAVAAAALSDIDIGGTVLFFPRVLVYSGGDPVGGPAPALYCEYADGAGGPAGAVALTKQAKAGVPVDEDILIDIGGTADCGVAGPGGPVASIMVPDGFYDVHASFAFFAADAP